jgi:hypothetical protein
MKGTINLTFTEDSVEVSTNLEIHKGIADKCFVIDTVCKALKLEGKEKRVALMSVAAKDLFDAEDTKNEG